MAIYSEFSHEKMVDLSMIFLSHVKLPESNMMTICWKTCFDISLLFHASKIGVNPMQELLGFQCYTCYTLDNDMKQWDFWFGSEASQMLCEFWGPSWIALWPHRCHSTWMVAGKSPKCGGFFMGRYAMNRRCSVAKFDYRMV